MIFKLTFAQISLRRTFIEKHLIHHHHHVDRSRTSMTLFFQYSLSLIAVSKSSLSRLVSSVSWLIKFRAGLPLVFSPHLGSHSINLCITLLRKQCPAKLTLCVAIVLVIFGKLSYSTLLLIRCCHFTLFTTQHFCITPV